MNEIANRLKAAREAAGFENATDCATRFGWKYATYAGHENGHRGIKLETLRQYASAFKVDVSWLLSGTTTAPKPAPLKPSTGFEESEVAPFKPRNPAEGQMMISSLTAFSPGARHGQIYRAQRDFACFSIIEGDLLLIGTPKTSRDGDIVIATLSSPDLVDVRTVLRQRFGETLVPAAYSGHINESRYSAGILGTILTVVRNTQI